MLQLAEFFATDKSFAAFRRFKRERNPVFSFKSCNRFKSFEYLPRRIKLRPNQHGQRTFYIQNVGELRMCYHGYSRRSKDQARRCQAGQSRWYVCLMPTCQGYNDFARPTDKLASMSAETFRRSLDG
jgi:hypothetical protein